MTISDMRAPFGVKHFGSEALKRGRSLSGARVLVAGCGDGSEAHYLASTSRAIVTAIDIGPLPAGNDGGQNLRFLHASVTDLPFCDASFDAVFCHHVLEHVDRPDAAVRELSRILTSHGVAYIGTPNRDRIVGYIGSRGTPWKTKLKWNLDDLSARLRGQFRNECGSHAGFGEAELASLLKSAFASVEPVTSAYIWLRYSHRVPSWCLRLLKFPRLRTLAYPSLYFWCSKDDSVKSLDVV